jgi:predicted metal-dependent phosphoesterase TrpH
MLKVELHAHIKGDPSDRILHTAFQLIDRAAQLGYGALAVTLHNRWTDPAPLAAYAEARGVTILSGIERNIGRKHLLLINGPRDAERLQTFDDVMAFKAHTGALVVAPHAFYPIGSAVGRILDERPNLADAIEINSMYVRGIDFNRTAVEWARRNGKPLVGNTDLHLLTQLGTTYSLVDCEERTPDAICNAIRSGRVQVITQPLSWPRAALLFTGMVAGGLLPPGQPQAIDQTERPT